MRNTSYHFPEFFHFLWTCRYFGWRNFLWFLIRLFFWLVSFIYYLWLILLNSTYERFWFYSR